MSPQSTQHNIPFEIEGPVQNVCEQKCNAAKRRKGIILTVLAVALFVIAVFLFVIVFASYSKKQQQPIVSEQPHQLAPIVNKYKHSQSEEELLQRYDKDNRVKKAVFDNKAAWPIAMAKQLIKQAKNILVITGAGISVASGIPDFRSPKIGLYDKIKEDFPELASNPTAVFSRTYYDTNPKPFYAVAKQLLELKATPTKAHHFVKNLEQQGKLLRNYTQNIDTLEQEVGITKVIYCHGSFLTSHCLNSNCKEEYKLEQFKQLLKSEVTPQCKKCNKGLIKPDITFFEEKLPEEFGIGLEKDLPKADLLIVIGTSLKVRPVSTIPENLSHVPHILINMQRHEEKNYDLELLGDLQETVSQLQEI